MVQIRAGWCKAQRGGMQGLRREGKCPWAHRFSKESAGCGEGMGLERYWGNQSLLCLCASPTASSSEMIFQPRWICAVTRLHNPTTGEEGRAYRMFALYPSFFLGVNMRKNKQIYRQPLVYWFYLIFTHISSNVLSPRNLTLTLEEGLFSEYLPRFCSVYLVISFSKAWGAPPSSALFSND